MIIYLIDTGKNTLGPLEKEIIKNISSRKGTVISTGGGVILDNENVELLKRNGIIFLLKASINTIVSNLKSSPSYQESRPLLKDSLSLRNRILEIYREREKLYLSSANMIVNVDGISIEKIGEEIIYVYKNLNPCSCNKSLI